MNLWDKYANYYITMASLILLLILYYCFPSDDDQSRIICCLIFFVQSTATFQENTSNSIASTPEHENDSVHSVGQSISSSISTISPYLTLTDSQKMNSNDFSFSEYKVKLIGTFKNNSWGFFIILFICRSKKVDSHDWPMLYLQIVGLQ